MSSSQDNNDVLSGVPSYPPHLGDPPFPLLPTPNPHATDEQFSEVFQDSTITDYSSREKDILLQQEPIIDDYGFTLYKNTDKEVQIEALTSLLPGDTIDCTIITHYLHHLQKTYPNTIPIFLQTIVTYGAQNLPRYSF